MATKSKGWEDFPLLQMPPLQGQPGSVISSLPLQPYAVALQKYALVLEPLLQQEDPDPIAQCTAQSGNGYFQYLTGKETLSLHFDEHFSRVSLVVGQQSHVTLEMTLAAPQTLSARTIDLILEEGATCHASIRGAYGWSFTTLRAQCKTASHLTVKTFCPGIRLDAHVQLLGERAECYLYGLAKLRMQQQCHTYIRMEHKAPHTTSKQLFKHVLSDATRASFHGKIFVAPCALKTDAFQRSANLLLGEQARATCRPNLEIFADDVKASHGATIGQIDLDQLFYLTSRGIPQQAAKELLINAFCAEVL